MSQIIEREARFMIGEIEFLVTYGTNGEREKEESLVDIQCSCCGGILMQQRMHKPLFGVIDVQVDDNGKDEGMVSADFDLLGEMGDQIEESTFPFVIGMECVMCDKCQEEDGDFYAEQLER